MPQPVKCQKDAHNLLFQAAALVFLLMGCFLRVYQLDTPPLEFHPTRQLHSAILARGWYARLSPDMPAEQRSFAIGQAAIEGIIEPPILEGLTALASLAAGREVIWVPRLAAGLTWLGAAFALILLLRRWSGWPAAAAAVGFWLLAPYSIPASRAFQPDPIMVSLLLWSIWALVRWRDDHAPARLIPIGLLGGAAVIFKTTAIFPLSFMLGAEFLLERENRKWLRSSRFWIMAGLVLLPSLLYFVYGTWIAGFSRGQFSMRFFPSLWLDPAFYLRWMRKIETAAGISTVALAFFGLLTPAVNRHRRLLFSCFAGYLVYCMVFTHHISTHDYYHLMLFPLCAIGLGALFGTGFDQIRRQRPWVTYVSAAVLLAWGVYAGYDGRSVLRRLDTAAEAARIRQAAELMRGYPVVGLFPDYAYALRYYGWISPEIWPDTGDLAYQTMAGQNTDFESLFSQKTAGRQLFAVMDFDALVLQPQLAAKLRGSYALKSETEYLLLYDLTSPKAP